MIAFDQFQELQRRVERAREARDRAAGARDAQTRRLKEEYGCKTPDEGRKKLKALTREELELYDKYNPALAAFEKKWAAVLGETDGPGESSEAGRAGRQ